MCLCNPMLPWWGWSALVQAVSRSAWPQVQALQLSVVPLRPACAMPESPHTRFSNLRRHATTYPDQQMPGPLTQRWISSRRWSKEGLALRHVVALPCSDIVSVNKKQSQLRHAGQAHVHQRMLNLVWLVFLTLPLRRVEKLNLNYQSSWSEPGPEESLAYERAARGPVERKPPHPSSNMHHIAFTCFVFLLCIHDDPGVGQSSFLMTGFQFQHTWWPWCWSSLMTDFQFQHMMALVKVNDDHSAAPRYETTKQQPNINQTTTKQLTTKQQPPNNNNNKSSNNKSNSKLNVPHHVGHGWPHVNNMSHHKKPCNKRTSVNSIKTSIFIHHLHVGHGVGPMTTIGPKTWHNQKQNHCKGWVQDSLACVPLCWQLHDDHSAGFP